MNDGITSGAGEVNCFIANYASKPWWTGDFGSEKRIKQVVVYPRTDCCLDQSNNYAIYIGNDKDFTKNPKCEGTWSGKQTIPCDLRGQYITIEK